MSPRLVKENSDGTVTVTADCVFTGKPHSVTVPTIGYRQWKAGKMIQEAMPDVSAEDREFLISGISPEGQKQIFKVGVYGYGPVPAP